MSIQSMYMRCAFGRSDRKRDALIPLPTGITECRNISYGSHGKWSLLDVCYPQGTKEPLPTIVSVHGGGFVYGTKEVYRRYCMSLASRGFSVVNFNYRLAPGSKFPAPLFDLNSVLEWIRRNAAKYHLDPTRIFLAGDSAGAQIASQYAAMQTNPGYAKKFQISLADVTIAGCALNCGLYSLRSSSGKRSGVLMDYLGKEISELDPRLQMPEAITPQFPPSFITTAWNDFLREQAQPLYVRMTELGIPAVLKCYGSVENKAVGHVFHINISLPEAIACNDDTAAFFHALCPTT